MTNIVLNDVTNTNQVSVLNDNFDKIEQHLNNKAIDRNDVKSLADDVDMNGFRLYNLPKPTSENEPARLRDLVDVVSGGVTGLYGVTSFNKRMGYVTLESEDVTDALGYVPPSSVSSVLTGIPVAPTAVFGTDTTQIATTKFVQDALTGYTAGVTSFNTRTGPVILNSTDVTNALLYTPANINSPALSGIPTATTAANGTYTTQLATTAFVGNAFAAQPAKVNTFNGRNGTVVLLPGDVTTALTYTPSNVNSPVFTGVPRADTAAFGTNTTQLATTAFVQNSLTSSGVASFNSRTGPVTLLSSDVTNALTYTPANLASPSFSGVPTVPTATAGTNTTQAASTAFVTTAVAAVGGASVTFANVTTALKSAYPYLEYNITSPWSGTATSNNFVVRRTANYTGGGVDSYGNRCIGSAIVASSIASAASSNCEMALIGSVYSNANISSGAAPLGNLWPQNVGTVGHAFQNGSAPVWGMWCVAQNVRGTVQAAGQGAIVGMEVNVGITGTDNYASSIAIDAVPQAIATGACSAYAAFRASGTDNQNWQYGFVAQQSTKASFMSSASGQYGIQLSGTYGVTVDLTESKANGLFSFGSASLTWLSGTHGAMVGGLRIYIDGLQFVIPVHNI